MNFHKHLGLTSFAILSLALLTASPALAQFTLIHSFEGFANDDGQRPEGAVTLLDNKLYGLTFGNSIFTYDLGTQTYSADPTAATGFGAFRGSLAASGTTMYGTTPDSNAPLFGGHLFAYDTLTETFSSLHEFDDNNEGTPTSPRSTPLLFGDQLYFTTPWTAQAGLGKAYLARYNLTANTYHNVKQIGDAADGLVVHGTKLYGAFAIDNHDFSAHFFEGGLFAYDTSDNTYNVVQYFPYGGDPVGGEGSRPVGTPVVINDKIYGVTQRGGNFVGDGDLGFGTIYEYDPLTDVLNILYRFAGGPLDGSRPQSIIADGNILYGMTELGGANDLGTIFSYNILTDSLNILHSFDGAGGATPFRNQLLLVDDTLFGMTQDGGASNFGTLFSLQIPEPASASLFTLAATALALRRRHLPQTNLRTPPIGINELGSASV